MPQFNSTDDSLPNHGIPERLMIYHPHLAVDLEKKMLSDKALGRLRGLTPDVLVCGKDLFDKGEAGGSLSAKSIILPLIEKINQYIHRKISDRAEDTVIRLFRDGNDSTGWGFEIKELFAGYSKAVMASFGAERILDLRNKTDPSILFSLKLESGSVLITRPALLEDWELRIPKMKGIGQPTVCMIMPIMHD